MHLSIFALAALSVLPAGLAVPPPMAKVPMPQGAWNVRTVRPAPFAGKSADIPVVNTIPLVPMPGNHSVSKINTLHKAKLAKAGKLTSGYSPILPAGGGTDYVTPVQFGTQTLNMIVDTGSADTWAPVTNFTCISLFTYMPTSQANCGFGKAWDISQSKAFKPVPNQRLDVEYGDGTFARGQIGTETVTVAQIAVQGQEVGAVNSTGWRGNGGDSGLMGLAFDALDNAYPVGAPTADRNRIRYNPLFANMYKSGAIAPVFSVNIVRNGTGSLSLGGIPKDVHTTTPYANAPFQYSVLSGIDNSTFSFFTINMTATWSAAGNGSKPTTGKPFPGVVDTGTTGVYLTEEDALAYNKGWNPPAKIDYSGSTWTVACNATPPALSLNVGDRSFSLAPQDLVYGNGDGTCASVVFSAGSVGPYIIGDAFLRRVLLVHDIGASELRVAGTE